MNGSPGSSTEVPSIPGPYLSPHQTESSPLRKSWEASGRFCCPSLVGLDRETVNSLKSITVVLYGFTIGVTFALFAQLYYGTEKYQIHGSVSTDDKLCSQIGLNILTNNGNAVDAAVASAFCLGVTNFHVTGLGGGGYMLIYNHRKHQVVDVLDFRESVPESYGTQSLDTSVEGLMVGVPGFVNGLFEAHKLHGKLPWLDLIQPSVQLARTGFPASQSLVLSKSYLHKGINSSLSELMLPIAVDQHLTLPQLAKTLELISLNGSAEFYNGSLASEIVYSVKEFNGGMTTSDLASYKLIRSNTLQTNFAGYEVMVPGTAAGGALLLNSLDSIQILDLQLEEDSVIDTTVKIADILQATYTSFLHKSHSVPDLPEPAASPVNVMDDGELYVALVTGLNSWLGSQIMTEAGFILNNAIANGGIDINRRPVSTAVPVIVTQPETTCGTRLILGGGDALVTAQVLTELLVRNASVSDSVERNRLLFGSSPHHVKVEESHNPHISDDILQKLKSLNYVIEDLPAPYTSVNVIMKYGDNITAYSDSRSGGESLKFR